MRGIELRHQKQFDRFWLIPNQNNSGIVFRVETDSWLGNIVGDDRVKIFRVQLLPGILNDIIGFSRKADDKLVVVSATRDLGQDVIGGLQFQLEASARLLNLRFRLCLRTIIRNGSGANENGSVVSCASNSFVHFGCRVNSRHVNRRAWRDSRCAGDHSHPGPPAQRSFRQRETHSPRRTIRYEANRIDWLARRAGRNQNLFVA